MFYLNTESMVLRSIGERTIQMLTQIANNTDRWAEVHPGRLLQKLDSARAEMDEVNATQQAMGRPLVYSALIKCTEEAKATLEALLVPPPTQNVTVVTPSGMSVLVVTHDTPTDDRGDPPF